MKCQISGGDLSRVAKLMGGEVSSSPDKYGARCRVYTFNMTNK
jgi:hypothetical protein